jgi:signal transduction histidine kinase
MIIVLVQRQARQQALNEAESKALLLLNRNLATHFYFSQEIKPKLMEWTEPFRTEDYFEPSWMSSTYAIRQIDKYFQELSPTGYYFKDAAISARSPENEADSYERAFLDDLAADPELEQRSDIYTINGVPYYVVMRRGEIMEDSCLQCHSEADVAPGDLVDFYGPERSFHRSVGDIVHTASIRIPLDAAFAEGNKFSYKLSSLLLALLLGLFAVQLWLNARLLHVPLGRMRDKALQIAAGGEHLGEEIPLPLGKELSELTSAFNVMSRSLRRNVDQFEERVQERTEELERVNAQLQRDVARRQRAEKALQAYSERLQDMVQERTQELRQAQEQLVRQERLAVLGQLSGGIGHELRNPLGTIKNSVYLLNLALDEPTEEVQETLEIMDRAVGTCENIIRSLLDFARGRPPARQEVNLKQLIQETLFGVARPEGVEIVTQLDQAPATLWADPDQLARVFGNLALNAVQAMPEGGRLTVQAQISSPGWVQVSFSDTGVGIPPENLDRLFEPLFTTKSRGLGLALALVKSLVEGHGGKVEGQSKVGEGSVFTVSLPIGTKEEQEYDRGARGYSQIDPACHMSWPVL